MKTIILALIFAFMVVEVIRLEVKYRTNIEIIDLSCQIQELRQEINKCSIK